MKIEKMYNGMRYTLSNEDLRKGDKCYPIAHGRCLADKDGKLNGEWILHDFDFREFMSGFPNEPHVIKNLKYSDYKPYEIQTDHGYGPIEAYYKIIKIEKQIEEGTKPFISHKWIEENIQH